mmetsp:Transcript_1396/g.3185  ORF Transcript_1396/g.3185 Transcript_1396/m.3185 type:complete len:205 (+) Transcript_1396:140-754(+)
MEDVATRKTSAFISQFEVFEANHTRSLWSLGNSSRWWRWGPCEGFDFFDGLGEEPSPMVQHVFELPGGALGAEQEHLQALRQLRHLVHQVWGQKVSQRRGQVPLAEDGSTLPDSSNHIGLTSYNFELHALISEEVTMLVLPVLIRHQVRLKVISKQLVLVGTGQCVHEGENMHLLELRSCVPVREDFCIRGHHSKPLGLRCLDL